jgi:hypothetical protein
MHFLLSAALTRWYHPLKKALKRDSGSEVELNVNLRRNNARLGCLDAVLRTAASEESIIHPVMVLIN